MENRKYQRSRSSVIASCPNCQGQQQSRSRPASHDWSNVQSMATMTQQTDDVDLSLTASCSDCDIHCNMGGIRPGLGSSKDSGIEEGSTDDLTQSQLLAAAADEMSASQPAEVLRQSDYATSDVMRQSAVAVCNGKDCEVFAAACDEDSILVNLSLKNNSPQNHSNSISPPLPGHNNNNLQPVENCSPPADDKSSENKQRLCPIEKQRQLNPDLLHSALTTNTCKCDLDLGQPDPCIFEQTRTQRDEAAQIQDGADLYLEEGDLSQPQRRLAEEEDNTVTEDALEGANDVVEDKLGRPPETEQNDSDTLDVDSDSDNEDILEACEQAEALSEHANNGVDDEEDDEDKFLEQHLIHRELSMAHCRQQTSSTNQTPIIDDNADIDNDLDWEYTGPATEPDVSDFLRDSQQPKPWLNLAYVIEEDLSGEVSEDLSVSRHESASSLDRLWLIDSNGSAPGDVSRPTHVSFMTETKLLVCDYFNQRLQIFNTQGDVTGLIADGEVRPWACATDRQGLVAVVDDGIDDVTERSFTLPPCLNNDLTRFNEPPGANRRKMVKLFDKDGENVGQWGLGEFVEPRGIAYNPMTACWVLVDKSTHTLSIHERDGYCIRRFGCQGNGNTQFDHPQHVACDSHGRILVSDSFNHCVKVFDKYGMYVDRWGSQGSFDYELDLPMGLCAEEDSANVLVCDHTNSRVTRYSPDGKLIEVLLSDVTWPVSVALNRTGHLAVATRSANQTPYTVGMWTMPLELGLVDDVSDLSDDSIDDILDGKEL